MDRIIAPLMRWHTSLFFFFFGRCSVFIDVSFMLSDLPTVLSSWEIKWEGLGLGVGRDRYNSWEGH